jgi:hypothetical protein
MRSNSAHPSRSKVRPDVGAPGATRLANETRLQIGQRNIVGPRLCADRQVMATTVVGAIDQQPGYASYPHFPKGDLLLSHAHDSPIERDGKPLRLVGVQGQATAIRHLDRNFVPFASLGLGQPLEPLARDSQPSVALSTGSIACCARLRASSKYAWYLVESIFIAS